MKAIRIHDYGGPEELVYEEVPDPLVSGDQEVLIRVRSCAINHLDLDLRSGISRFPLKLPHILGMEFAGDVKGVGSKVQRVAVGDKVLVAPRQACGDCKECQAGRENKCLRMERFGLTRAGGYAELVVAPADLLIPLNGLLDYDHAAALPVAFGTAWRMLITLGNLRPGETVLIQAVGSGIGSAAVQVARLAGARVIGTAGDDFKLKRARELGLDVGINYHDEDFATRVMAETGGAGVDLVFEHVGGDVFLNSLKCIRPQGRIIVAGAHAGELVELDLVRFFRLEARIIGMTSATLREIKTAVSMADQGRLQAVVDSTFPLEQAAEAHRYLASRQHFGKVILHP